MPITVTNQGGSATISLVGEVDHHGAHAMMIQIEDNVSRLLPMHLTLDLSGVTFMDSSGIAVLLRALRQMEHLGGTLQVIGVPPQARRVLDAAGIGRLISLE